MTRVVLIGNGGGLPFVGRQRELAAFQAHLEAAYHGHGGIVFVAGEPGIGKTRLLLEKFSMALAKDIGRSPCNSC